MTTESVEPSAADAPTQAAPVAPPEPVEPAAPAAPGAPSSPAAAAPAETPAAAAFPPAEAPAFPPAEPSGFPPAAAPLPVGRPRRPRPVLLLVSGLLLGAVVGGAVGYAIQAGRPPTPLPPIQVALPSYPAAAVDPGAAAAAAPKPLAIDGDLRKLLMSAPAGATPWADYPDTPTWITVGELAERSGRSAEVFKTLNAKEFRRAVEVDWKQDGLKVRVSLIQFSADRAAEAKSRATGYNLKPFADDANGGYHVDSEASYWAETTEKYYLGTAHAQRGTVVMEIKVFGTESVNPDVVKGIAKQQWERLV
ncbi:hypothetical protein RMN57_20945 [Kitasatospora sp. CM 4170]|uniref:Uncharacterized protein n=1 Tax=Kitasatospora aburaviensis TaxID=67265 RepID=A0ABW1F736_9ACTN|nr:hypothetical protein [Kitasatospora sp. CM 4170]WNM46994.1 hypothetical protein RMN57_20945 [Kitasatospora sp. CM 4170]